MSYRHFRHRAFTVLELLVVVVVLGILAGIMLIKFGGMNEKSYIATMQSDLRNFATFRAIHMAEGGPGMADASDLPTLSFSDGVFEAGYHEDNATQWALVVGHAKTDVTCSLSTLGESQSQRIKCSEGESLSFSATFTGRAVQVDADAAITALAFGDDDASGAAWAALREEIALVSWMWGDGEVTSGPASAGFINTSHVYNRDGDYTIRLTLVKRSGETKSGERKFTVQQAPSDGNLVVNGDGALGHFNFSNFTYVPEPVEGAAGYFQLSASGERKVFSDQQPIPIDTTKAYRLEALVRAQTPAQDRYYIGFRPFDMDDNAMERNTFLRRPGTDTRLAAPLTPGDQVVHLVDASGWRNDGNVHSSALTIWNYRSASGHDYGEYTYSQRYVANAWGAGAVDFQSNTVHLTKPLPARMGNPDHPQGTWPAGQAVSNGWNGLTYHYCAAQNSSFTSEWTRRSGLIQGVGRDGSQSHCQVPPGTAKISPVFLVGFGSMTGPVVRDFADIRLVEVP